ncbi:restriction endonuclease subunit S [Enterovibrio norvegicus]|uniref:restriction endonuclease subunit S n=1 Tax=Enterovibrio norvegicus TaxID=188144 RepID=UPI0013D16349|nr:restriction endonuclease subunit S [Enterovibrio norvegicus]
MSAVIPEGWLEQPIGNIADVVAGGTPKAGDPNNFAMSGTAIAWLTPADLSKYNSKSISHGARDLSQEGYDSSSAKLMPKGALLFSSRAPIGYVVIAENPICTNQGFKNFVFTEQVDSTYAFYYLKSIRDLAESLGSGTTFKELSGATAKTIPFRLAPLAEQKVIADKLDELLAQVESTKARLDAIPAILKSFRQSVLAAAVSGKLTEEWRDGKKLNPENDLKCELSLNEGKKRKIEATSSHELVSDNFSTSWPISKFDELYRFIDYRGKTPKKSEYGKRLYTAKNIKMGYLSNEPVEYLSEEDYKSWMTRGFSKMNDIFFVTEGHTMGCVAINTIGSDIALAQRTLTLQPYGNVRTKFHYYFMLTNSFQKLVDLNATGTAAKGIKASKFRGLPLPFPAYEEQTEIVRRVEELFAFADKIEAQVNAAQERVNNLTQSILAKAFKGELTADWRAANPDLISGENSAEALLERIKAERETLATKKKPAKKASIRKKA